MKTNQRASFACVPRALPAVLLAAALAGCGGGGDDSTGPGATPPSPPSGLAATANSTTQITLTWVLPAGTVTEVKIERSVAGAAFAALASQKPAGSSYVDAGLTAGTAYRYQVQACNGSTCSTFAEVSTTTPTTNNQTPLAIWNPALPPSLVNYTYDPILRTTGGTGTTRTWSLVSGSLPSGVTLNADGTFRGTPTATGNFPITVRVAGGSETAQKNFTITIFQPDLTRWNVTRMDTQPVPANIEPTVQAAIRRWESIITGDLHVDTIPNGFYRATDCGGFGRAAEGAFIDDFFLIVNIVTLPGNVLGQATTCGVRYDDETSVIGILTLNSGALNSLDAKQAENVTFHEIGHTLGFGIMWFSDKFNYVAENHCVSLEQIGMPEFLGPLAVKAWQDSGRTGNPPIEDTGGAGTVCSHWKKTAFRTELMTGSIEPAGVTQQVSAITVASMADLGFKVDMTKADPYTPAGAPAALERLSPWTSDWMWPGPWEIVQPEPVRRLPKPGASRPR
jgi:hypothetical protein